MPVAHACPPRRLSCLHGMPGILGALFLSVRPRFQQQLLPWPSPEAFPHSSARLSKSPLLKPWHHDSRTCHLCPTLERYKGWAPGSLVIRPRVLGWRTFQHVFSSQASAGLGPLHLSGTAMGIHRALILDSWASDLWIFGARYFFFFNGIGAVLGTAGHWAVSSTQ